MSLDVTYDSENVFAKIIRGDIPAVHLYETDDVLAFMDVYPQSEGHCLVVHKKASAINLLDIETDKLSALAAAVQKIAAAVKASLSPDGIRIAQFNGAAAGQTVFHLHFHIIPVYEGQSLTGHSDGKQAESATLQECAKKIKAKL